MTMFEIGKVYWFEIKSEKFGKVTTKGKVLDENQYIVKIEKDLNKEIELIPQQSILRINIDKTSDKGLELKHTEETDFTKG